MTIAGLTGGQYVPMVDAGRLTEMIINGVREEISLDTLMQTSRGDITREMRKATVDGVDDTETAKRLQRVFTNKKKYVNRMHNDAGTPSKEVEECYSKCSDMSDIQKKYKKVDKVPTTTTAETNYKLEQDTTVSLDQAKRIVQKAKNWNYAADQESEACKYGERCYDQTSHHRKKFSHPESDHSTTRSNHETKRNDHTTTRSNHETKRNDHTTIRSNHETERNDHTTTRRNDSHRDNDSRRTECNYGANCYDHTSHHRTRYSHPESDHSTTRSNDHTTVKNEKAACRYSVNCDDHTSHHRTKYSHPEKDDSSSRWSHQKPTNDSSRTPCKYVSFKNFVKNEFYRKLVITSENSPKIHTRKKIYDRKVVHLI